jgi:hypothetical protein
MRGGKRVGAGRSRKLNHLERIYLGSLCEQRFQTLWDQARWRRWEERAGVNELHKLQERFRSVPVTERKSFRTSSEGRELSEDIEFSIREIRRTPSFVDEIRRGFTLNAPRPKGVKADICEAVAAEVTAKWNVKGISRRYVQRCWDEYRAFERDFRTIEIGME